MAKRRVRDTRTLDLFARPTRSPAAPAPTAAPHTRTLHALDPSAIEVRPYADLVFSEWDRGGNFGIVADTASGKTYLALLLADAVLAQGARVLITAPTNPLCDQHERVGRTLFQLPEEAIAFTRSVGSAKKRAAAWAAARIVIATPQRIAVGLERGTLTLDGFGLIVVDECHHAADRHASIAVARAAAGRGIRVVGLTASPGDDAEAIDRVRKNLQLERWVHVPDTATDPFRPPVRKHRIRIPLPPAFAEVVRLLEETTLAYTTVLAEHGHLERALRTPSPNELTDAIAHIRRREEYASMPYAAGALQLSTALTTLVAGDCVHALDMLRSAIDRRRDGGPHTATAKLLRSSADVIAAGKALRAIVDAGTPHPKWVPLLAVIHDARAQRPDVRILVYTRYATTAEHLTTALAAALGIRVAAVLGRKRQKIAETIARLDAFARGEIPIVVATPVIREGLHIPAIDLLIEYAPPLNGIERTQLHGRVGRTASGVVCSLVAEHDLDRRYAFSAEAGIRNMRRAMRAVTGNVVSIAHAYHTRRSAFTGAPRKPIAALAANTQSGMIFDRYAIRTHTVRHDRRGIPYVEFTVGDRSGTLLVRHWCPDGIAEAHALIGGFPDSCVIIIRGFVDPSDLRTIIVNPREGQSIVACPAGDYDPADYVAPTPAP